MDPKIIILEIVVAWVYGYALEYFLHRNLLHNRNIPLFFKIHFSEHHKKARRNKMIDDRYLTWRGTFFHLETYSLIFLALVHFPVSFYFPFAYSVVVLNICTYFFIHRRAHIDSWWGRENLEWHYDHHMALDPDKNWGIRATIIDDFLKTRKIYKSTTAEFERHSREIKEKLGKIERKN